MRVALLSDIHSNLEALDAVRARLLDAKIDEVWVLGDIVGYGADPTAVVGMVAEIGTRVIGGNHDLATTGRFDVSWFNAAAAEAILWTSQELSGAARSFLEGLEPASRNGALLVHGSVVDPVAEYLLDVVGAAASFRAADFRRCFFGHTHLPTLFTLDGRDRVRGGVIGDGERVGLREDVRYMLNPGSVGQPRDGDPRASFMVYDSDAEEVVLHRVAYDVDRAAEKIRRAGLPAWLADRLSAGE
jgi:diadenosine tetraphosphatase ApaH/serine/threonine PP2A family protein phosphatase